MIIGTIKEKKKFENRVAISPDEAKNYIKSGHQVLIEKNAGLLSGFTDKSYKEAGATVVQELAYTLAHAVEYFDKMTEEGFTTDAVARSFIFRLGYGNSYFTEIAKGRAFHYLVDQLYNQYNTKHRIVIWGDSSKYYQSHKDAL